MLDTKPVDKIVFFDIETTSQYPTFAAMPERFQKLFKKRFKKDFSDVDMNAPSDTVALAYEEIYNTKAPLFSEWGRILCISMGMLVKLPDGPDYEMKKVTYYDDDEKVLLQKFLKGTEKMTDSTTPLYHWCAHNAKVFDVPFITKRIIINKLPLPRMFDFAHLKPWELNYIIDTKEVWCFGVKDNATSLDTLTALFDIPSSKDDIDGSEVKNIYWIEKDLPRIVIYCEKDIVALARIYLQMKGIYCEVIVK